MQWTKEMADAKQAEMERIERSRPHGEPPQERLIDEVIRKNGRRRGGKKRGARFGAK